MIFEFVGFVFVTVCNSLAVMSAVIIVAVVVVVTVVVFVPSVLVIVVMLAVVVSLSCSSLVVRILFILSCKRVLKS